MLKILPLRLFIALLPFSSLLVAAEDKTGANTPIYIKSSDTSLRAFGTIGAVYNSNQEITFTRTVDQLGEPDRQYQWKPDTRIGGQINHRFSPQFELVGQAVLREQYHFDLNKAISRAFLAWQPIPEMRVRVGRIHDDTYQMLDFKTLVTRILGRVRQKLFMAHCRFIQWTAQMCATRTRIKKAIIGVLNF